MYMGTGRERQTIIISEHKNRTNKRMFCLKIDSLVCESKFNWFVYPTGLIYRDLFDIKGVLRPIINIT